MKEIPLTRGYVALVDEADFERVSMHKWHASVQKRTDGSLRVYGRRNVYPDGRNGRHVPVFLHRFILGMTDGFIQVDHKNLNTLDCSKDNLRIASNSQNQGNTAKRSCNKSGYKGVIWDPRLQKWLARLKFQGKLHYLGLYSTPQEASAAYLSGATEVFGEFART